MRKDYFLPGDKVLLLGEGNFSFALSLYKMNLNIDITATCYESSVVFDTGSKNINYLKTVGVKTMLGIDATKLDDHFDSELINFDRVVFNFPHVGGKMRIERNRKLLKEFFISVSKLINKSSTIMVTLCDGQGGTPSDERKRRRDDSWRIDEMAAYGNFLLTNVERFEFHNFPYYNCVGYRSLEKSFFNEKALVHIFQITDNIEVTDLKNFNENYESSLKFTDELKYDRSFDWKETVAIIDSSNRYDKKVKNFEPVALFAEKFSLHVTFKVDDNFNEFDFFKEIYILADDVVDGVKYLYEYESNVDDDSKKITRTYEISYKSYKIPLYRERVIDIHNNFIVKIIEDRLNLIVSK